MWYIHYLYCGHWSNDEKGKNGEADDSFSCCCTEKCCESQGLSDADKIKKRHLAFEERWKECRNKLTQHERDGFEHELRDMQEGIQKLVGRHSTCEAIRERVKEEESPLSDIRGDSKSGKATVTQDESMTSRAVAGRRRDLSKEKPNSRSHSVQAGHYHMILDGKNPDAALEKTAKAKELASRSKSQTPNHEADKASTAAESSTRMKDQTPIPGIKKAPTKTESSSRAASTAPSSKLKRAPTMGTGQQDEFQSVVASSSKSTNSKQAVSDQSSLRKSGTR